MKSGAQNPSNPSQFVSFLQRKTEKGISPWKGSFSSGKRGGLKDLAGTSKGSRQKIHADELLLKKKRDELEEERGKRRVLGSWTNGRWLERKAKKGGESNYSD